jgi:hypothetical protein
MKLAVRRVDSDGRYVTLIARDDGVTFSMQGVGHNFAIPHDVAHYVVEKALCLDGGFWGSVSEGAVFPTMTYVAGRRKPKAVERSSLILTRLCLRPTSCIVAHACCKWTPVEPAGTCPGH